MTIGSCGVGEGCGTLRLTTRDYQEGEVSRCFGLNYEGFQQDRGAFSFDEVFESGICGACRVDLTPMQGSITVGIQEYCGGSWVN